MYLDIKNLGRLPKEFLKKQCRGKKDCIEKEENPYNKKNHNCISELHSKYSGFFFTDGVFYFSIAYTKKYWNMI